MNAVVMPMFKPDIDAMAAHVDHLFGGFLDGYQDGLVELSWTDSKPDDGGRHRLRHARLFGTDQLDDLVEEAARLNAVPMTNVYIGAALRRPDTAPFGRAQDSDAWALTCAYVDLDDEGAVPAARAVYGHAKPTMVVVTGTFPHTRAQLWWRLEEPATDPAHWETVLRGMAVAMNGDTTVTNPSRVMRLAGSIAWPVKDGRVCEVTSIAPLRSPGQSCYAGEHIEHLFPPVAKGAAEVDTGEALARSTNGLGLADKINDGRERYMRDMTAAALISFVGENGCAPTPQELFDAAWPVYERKADLTRPGRGRDEFAEKCRYTVDRFHRGEIRGVETLEKAIVTARRKRQAREAVTHSAAAPAPPAAELAALIPIESAFPVDPSAIPTRDWVIPGVLLRRYLSVLVAPPGSGKSLLTLQLSLAVCLGMNWGGWQVRKPAKTLVINAEDDLDEMRRRLWGAAKAMQVDQSQLAGKLFLAQQPESIVIARTDAKSKTVIRTPLLEQLVRTMIENDIGMVVVDPFAETFEGDENSNSEVKWAGILWREVARRTGAAVFLVHHTRKYAGAMAGDADASRGGGALIGTARIVSTLFSMTEEEAGLMNVQPEDRTKYVRFDDAKANLSVVSGVAKWFEKITLSMPNGSGIAPGDDVGVLAPWKPPGLFEGVSVDEIHLLLETIDRGVLDRDGASTGHFWTASANSADKSRWAGTLVCNRLGCDEAMAKKVIKEWLKSGLLVAFEYDDPRGRQERKGIKSDPAKWPGRDS